MVQLSLDPSKIWWDLASRFEDNLEHMDLSETSQLRDLSGIAGFNNLRSLNLSGCFGLRDIKGLGSCTQLRNLNLRGCSQILTLDELSGCTLLEELNVGYCLGLDDIEVIDGLTKLVQLTIPAGLEEQTNVAVTREDEFGIPGALKVTVVGTEEDPDMWMQY